MKRSLGLASLTLMAVIGPAHAVDDLGGFVDLRLGYETFNTKYRLRYGPVDAEDNFDITHRITLNWIGSLGLRSYGGWLWGLGGTWYYNKDQIPGAASGEFTYQTWLVQGHLGYGVPIGNHMQVEFLPYLGYGWAYLRIDNFPSSNWQNGSDNTYEVGINSSFVYTFDNGLQLGANGRYFLNEAGITDTNSGTRFSFHMTDFSVGVFVGARL